MNCTFHVMKCIFFVMKFWAALSLGDLYEQMTLLKTSLLFEKKSAKEFKVHLYSFILYFKCLVI